MSNNNSTKQEIRSIFRKAVTVFIAGAFILCFATGCPNSSSSDSEELTKPEISAPAPDLNTPAPENTPEPEDTDIPPSDDQPIGDSGLDATDLSALITALPDNDALTELHSIFLGFWINNVNSFVGFVIIDGVPGIEYGLFQTSYWMSGKIIDSRAVNDREAEFTILIPERPATEMDDAMPERTDIINIDISNYTDNRLNIKVFNLDDGEWCTYEFGGSYWEEVAVN